MKKTFYLLALITLISSCRDKYIWCEDIGQNVKPWSVYDLNDSISMHDQSGNHVFFKIDQYYNKPAYEMTQSGGLMKKLAVCKGSLALSSHTDYFRMDIESSTRSNATSRKPDLFEFLMTVGDLTSRFTVSRENTNYTINSDDGYATVQTNYTSGNVVYPEAFVCETDSSTANTSVYRFVYAKDKGLVEFSTKNPARTYYID